MMGAYLSDVTQALEAHFRTVQRTRMHDVPILNPALSVAAVGFRLSHAGYLGVMVTPWFMNLILLPLENHDWSAMPEGGVQTQVFDSGAYDFLVAGDNGIAITTSGGLRIERYQACSLLSPVLEIDSQETALDVALAAMFAVEDPDFRDTESSTRAAELMRHWQPELAQTQPETPDCDDAPETHATLETESASAATQVEPENDEGIESIQLSRRDLLRGRFGKTDPGRQA